MKLKYTVNFYLEKRKSKANIDKNTISFPDAPIFMFFSFDNRRLQYYTGYRIDSWKWDEITQRVKKNNFNQDGVSASDINDHLDKIKGTVQEIYKEYKILEKNLSIQAIRNELKLRLKEDKRKRKTFFQCYAEYLEEVKRIRTVSTVKKYNTLLNHLMDFQRECNYKVEFESINADFFRKFIDYLLEVSDHINSTIAKNLKLLKSFLNWASSEDKGYNQNRYYKAFKHNLKGVDSFGCSKTKKIVFLTWPEFTHLYNLEIDEPHLERVRDVFCFGCTTGLRYSDIYNLKRSNIKDNYIETAVIKEEERVVIELNDYSRNILEKYKEIQFEEDKCLPVISEQRMNQSLKILGQKAGFKTYENMVYYKGPDRIEETFQKWQLLTSHVAKKTFVSNALFFNIPMEIIKSWTGNKDDRVFKAYQGLTQSQRTKEMQKFNQT
jgi:integrase